MRRVPEGTRDGSPAEADVVDLKRYIRDIPDFPKPGIVFKDITPLLADGGAFRATIERFVERYRGRVDVVLGIESRGFLIGAAAAYGLGTGVALVRKPGKLPAQTYAARYELEYGSDSLEIHHDAIDSRRRVLVLDDLLATGGTASAAVELVHRTGGEVVACAFVIELAFLDGRRRLANHEVFSLLRYDTP
jgi:adenine phosphoribosyltransferase